ncbi:MAG: TetR/AcrR family transcriptional regulator [Myxococcota bacterium]
MGRTSDARERLIEEASRLFHEHSYEGVGVQELCDAADINKGSFYHFFKSKDELAAAVIDAYGVAVRDELLAPTLADDVPPLARIERFFEELTREQRAGRRDLGITPGCPLANLAGELCNHEPKLRKKLARVFDGMRDALEATLRDAIAKGELPRGTNAAQGAEALVALAEGACLLSATHDDPALVGRVGRMALALVGAKGA